MSAITGSAAALKEEIVRQALKSCDWAKLESHLLAIGLDDQGTRQLAGHIRRSSDFLIKRADKPRENRRAIFVEKLRDHLEASVGASAAELLAAEVELIERIERGYREIMETQDASPASNLAPDTQAAAALVRSGRVFDKVTEAVWAKMKALKEIPIQSIRIEAADGSPQSPDGVLALNVEITTMTLQLLGYRQSWFDDSKRLVVPSLPKVEENDASVAAWTESTAAAWRMWERMEQRCRYFGGSIDVRRGDDLPKSLPPSVETELHYQHLAEAEVYDYFANTRLNDRMVQTFQEMQLSTNMVQKSTGIANAVGLSPAAFVSPAEAHAIVALSEILGYAVGTDQERPCGLRLVEWVRGYAALQCLAENRTNDAGKPERCFVIARDALVAILDRVGLTNGTAEKFIDQASLRASSRDLFDQPLVCIGDASLLVYGPGILSSDLARVTLSAIGSQGVQLGKKGKAFERETLRFFTERGYDAKAFKFKRNGEEFEYDVVVPWNDHLFIFECKNRSLSGNNPIAAYYFELEIGAAAKQVRRLADALIAYPDAAQSTAGIDITGKALVPCVLNSLPYSRNDDIDGVFVTDASAMKRFFAERYLHINRAHRVGSKGTVLHRTPTKALWKGETPAPRDLVEYLKAPPQLELLAEHSKAEENLFALSHRTVVSVTDLTHSEVTAASITKHFALDQEKVDRDVQAIARAVRTVSRRIQKKEVKAADRAWRATRQNNRL